VAVLADAAEGARALAAACRRIRQSRPERRNAIRAATMAAAEKTRSVQPQMSYLAVLREVLPRDGIVTDEMAQAGFTAWFGFPVYQPRTFISSGYQGTLGSGFPTALGVKVAHPDRPVVAICGDGGFMFAVQELATAVQYGIGVVTLVFNNQAYGNVRRDQRDSFGGRVIASDLVNPDFVALARSFGVEAERVDSPDAFRPVLERALSDGGPWLIEIVVPPDSEASPWPFIMPPPPRPA
jgi:acetolactate synthase-1/2/3 large subunit